jgi:predicted DCC family thiol-disulfide oxidoreductase YuxK
MTVVHEGAAARQPANGWVLYDSSCGFCSRWVGFWEKVLQRHGFAIEDLQSAFETGRLRVSEEDLLNDIRVVTQDGQFHNGADAYLFVGEKIWWAWPIQATFRLPGFNSLLWLGYRWFNRNRHRISFCLRAPEE